MTTIAFKAGILASDTKVCGGDVYLGEVDKIMLFESQAGERCAVAMAGTWTDILAVRQWIGTVLSFSDYSIIAPRDLGIKDADAHGLLLVHRYEENILFKVEGGTLFRLPAGKSYAVGSGRDFAMGVMDFGGSAPDAIRVAGRRCLGTDGLIWVAAGGSQLNRI